MMRLVVKYIRVIPVEEFIEFKDHYGGTSNLNVGKSLLLVVLSAHTSQSKKLFSLVIFGVDILPFLTIHHYPLNMGKNMRIWRLKEKIFC